MVLPPKTISSTSKDHCANSLNKPTVAKASTMIPVGQKAHGIAARIPISQHSREVTTTKLPAPALRRPVKSSNSLPSSVTASRSTFALPIPRKNNASSNQTQNGNQNNCDNSINLKLKKAEEIHCRQVEQLNADFSKKLAKMCEEWSTKYSTLQLAHDSMQQAHEQLTERFANCQELQADLERRHAEEKNLLLRRADELETTLKATLEEKANFQMFIAKESQEKMDKLSNDIAGLNFALDQKTEEIRKLRAENFDLQSEVDSLQQTKVEIHKLRSRLDDTNGQLKRQQAIQKELIQQLERCREETQNSLNISKIKEQENEMLKYKIQYEFTPVAGNDVFGPEKHGNVNDDSPHASWKSLNCSTPLSSRMRDSSLRTTQRSGSVSSRRNSVSVMEQSAKSQRIPLRKEFGKCGSVTGEELAPTKSTDVAGISALSVVQSQGRTDRVLRNTLTKIYTPKGTYEVHNLSLLQGGDCEDNDDTTENNNSSRYVDFDATGDSFS